ncbi:hypothetical protein [Archaeoglobus neptunius]|uniref:hypothetical protein n=1 Tax=Archaeoglobus neptunius TaxID=2798580 RepID=UPI0019290F72|nr:hypothetical protein [Archaeoglobus neptunius]
MSYKCRTDRSTIVYTVDFEMEDRARPALPVPLPPAKNSAVKFGVSDDLVAAKSKSFEDFTKAIWHSVNKVRKQLHIKRGEKSES